MLMLMLIMSVRNPNTRTCSWNMAFTHVRREEPIMKNLMSLKTTTISFISSKRTSSRERPTIIILLQLLTSAAPQILNFNIYTPWLLQLSTPWSYLILPSIFVHEICYCVFFFLNSRKPHLLKSIFLWVQVNE